MKKLICILFAFIFGVAALSAQGKLKIQNLSSSYETTYGSCSISIAYPISENPVFNKAINNQILEFLRDLGDKSEELDRKAEKVRDAASMNLFIMDISKIVAIRVSEEWEETVKDLEEDDYLRNVKCEHDLDFRLINDNPHYACFNVVDFGYYGGAHGFTNFLPIIVRKSDGKAIREVFRKDKIEQFRDYLKTNMYKDDFGGLQLTDIEKDDWKGKAEIASVLRAYDSFSEPELAWIDGDDVYIQYQQYEILPYAYGAPEIVVPVRIAMPYLTDEVKNLLNVSKIGSKKKISRRGKAGIRRGSKVVRKKGTNRRMHK